MGKFSRATPSLPLSQNSRLKAKMKISLNAGGLLSPAGFSRWRDGKRKSIRNAIVQGMREGGAPLVESARAEMRRAFRVERQAFLKSMRAKVYASKPGRLPALLIGSKIEWLGIHARGGIVSAQGKKMLIPLTEEGKRMGRKAFKRAITGLMRSGNAYFIQKNGKAILMAENIKENGSDLRRFKRAERLRSGQKRIKRGQEIPVAVLVPQVKLRRRFELESVVRAQMPALAAAIERRLKDA